MRVAETEHAAIGPDEPIPAAIRCRGHGDNGCADLLALRAEEMRVAEGQNGPGSRSFVSDQVRWPVSHRSLPGDRAPVCQDKRHKRHYDSRSNGPPCWQ